MNEWMNVKSQQKQLEANLSWAIKIKQLIIGIQTQKNDMPQWDGNAVNKIEHRREYFIYK